MRALILTAGLGTRLRPLTSIRAKAAVPLNGEPIVRRTIAWLVSQGVADLVLNLHHRPASIAALVGDGRDLGARVRYSWEQPVLGSAGGPRHALPLLVDGNGGAGRAARTFLLVNGDTLTDLRLRGLFEAHTASDALVTMALVPNPRPDVYGGVVVESGRVTGFTRRGDSRQSFHFIGVQVAAAEAFEGLEDGVPAESVAALYPRLMRQAPGAIAGYVTRASFSDVGTPADYLQTSIALAEAEGDRMQCGSGVVVDPSARVSRTALWDRVTVGPGADLEDCIVCDGVAVPAGVRYRRCAIVPHTAEPVGDDERVENGLRLREF